MCQDGKWGLMESEGSVLLPCRADNPVRRCASSTLKWHYVVSASSEDWKTYNDTLAAANAGRFAAASMTVCFWPGPMILTAAKSVKVPA